MEAWACSAMEVMVTASKPDVPMRVAATSRNLARRSEARACCGFLRGEFAEVEGTLVY